MPEASDPVIRATISFVTKKNLRFKILFPYFTATIVKLQSPNRPILHEMHCLAQCRPIEPST